MNKQNLEDVYEMIKMTHPKDMHFKLNFLKNVLLEDPYKAVIMSKMAQEEGGPDLDKGTLLIGICHGVALCYSLTNSKELKTALENKKFKLKQKKETDAKAK